MDTHLINFSKKNARTAVVAVTLGNLLEWYEIYLYVYWAPIISHLFFKPGSDSDRLINAFLVFAVGFLARPLGGLVFGRIGDVIGRKRSLILSIVMMIIPTFITGLLPTYEQIGCFAPSLLILMRILQSFPAGGELPGAFCYLYESAPLEKRRFLSSWSGVGYQLGILISTLECYFLEKHMSPENLMQWGWRISFIVGGLIGVSGLLLRFQLHETPVYREMVTHEKLVKKPVWDVLKRYKSEIFTGICYSALCSSAFYLISINLADFFSNILMTGNGNRLLFTAIILVLITVPLPLFGMLGDRYNNKKILVGCTTAIIFLLYPLYLSLESESLLVAGFVVLIFGLLITCITALIPYIFCDLFPTYARFTCVAVSFNIVDAIIGGFTPVASLYLFYLTNSKTSFCWILLVVSLVSLYSYLKMPSRHVVHK